MFTRDYSNSHYGGLAYILAGNGYTPLSPGFIEGLRWDYDMVHVIPYKERILESDRKQNDAVKMLPTTHQFLLDNIYS